MPETRLDNEHTAGPCRWLGRFYVGAESMSKENRAAAAAGA